MPQSLEWWSLGTLLTCFWLLPVSTLFQILSQPFSKSFILSCGSVYVPSDLVYFGFLILPMYFSSIMPALSFGFSTKAPWLLKSYPERVYLSKKSKVSISLYLPSWLPRQESRLRRERTQPHASTQDANHVISNSWRSRVNSNKDTTIRRWITIWACKTSNDFDGPKWEEGLKPLIMWPLRSPRRMRWPVSQNKQYACGR